LTIRDIIDKIKFFFVKKKLLFNKNFVVFLIFVFISTVFWLLKQLEQEYIADISCPVHFTNIPKNKIVVSDLPSKLILKVKSRGYQLLEYKITNSLLPFKININSLSLRIAENNKSYNFFVLTSSIKDNMEKQFDSKTEIISIFPDTIFFKFDNRITKKVPVNVNFNVNFKKQYFQKEKTEIIPDSISISGAESIIDTINKVITRKNEYFDVDNSIKDNIELVNIKNVRFSQDKVVFLLSVEEYTEYNIKIPIRVINKPDSVVLRTFPNEITISFLVGFSNYDKIIKPLFDVIVDYSEISEKTKLKVQLMKCPDYIKLVRVKPEFLEYIIEK